MGTRKSYSAGFKTKVAFEAIKNHPMKNLWELAKGEVVYTVFSTLEEIETKTESVLSPFWQSVERVFAHLPDNSLPQGVATFLEQVHSTNWTNFN